ncbi:hypothetical protein ABFG93_22500 (plasmid) [Pseudalkalibacillus hwajinpoensis]|uniref:hypothetical protein n=1 Tax=Guptibacillus hwajinpoensis TaxID=208199 RepID=UPI00325B45A6
MPNKEIDEEEIYLGIGDRFTIDNYPNNGDETVVRVIERAIHSNQADGNNRIEYTLDFYEEK